MTEEEASAGLVVTENLKRSFGKVKALDGFDMALPAGKVTALVGPNGAGKTTLLLILAGLLAPESGSARLGGINPVTQPFAVHRTVGWMPDFFGVYDGLSSTEYLELFAAAYGTPKSERNGRARELLALVGLEGFADAKVHTMSRGQKQRLGFARTIVHRPTVLLLDEPASGLDPRARIELRELVRQQAAEGAAVLVSSHILGELEEMSDLVVFAEAGKSRGMFPLSELPSEGGVSTWKIRALDPQVLETSLRTADHGVTFLPDGAALVELPDEGAAADLVDRLVREGVRLIGVTPQSGGLESAFMSLERKDHP
jgi:ABC-2 type transport system ATP-binding protein